MKYAFWVLGILVLLLAGLFALQYAASERVEVVELHTPGESDETVTTRLWVVDHEGKAYLRAGGEGSGWFTRVQANPEISLTRGGKTRTYLAVPRPDERDVINALMREKYTWGDRFIEVMLGGRDDSIPIALEPADEDQS